MGKSVSKKLLSGVLSAMMVASSVPAAITAYADQCDQGTKDGYDYELWNQSYKGNVQMNVGNAGTFSCSWSGIENCLFRSGKRLGSTQSWSSYGGIQINYDVDYTPKGNSYMCVYGWTQSPLVEYYIVEAWGDWRPPGSNSPKTSITVDGKAYDVFTSTRYNQPSIEGTKTFEQYWSVQKNNPAQVNVQKNLKGTITVSEHFKAWEKAGMQMGKMYEVALNIEGYQSSGSANVKKNELIMGSVVPGTTAPVVTKQPGSDGRYFKESFESGAGDWSGRGAASVEVNSTNHSDGSKSLYVSGRTDNWNGAAITLDPSEFVPGNSYSFSAKVLQTTESSTSMKMTLQYNDGSEEKYDEVASATAKKGEWTDLTNTSYKIPSGASSMVLYIEAPDSLTDFYVDATHGAKAGTAGYGDTSVVVTPEDNPQPYTPEDNPQPYTPQGDTSTLKGNFAPYFKFGTSVSPFELSSGGDFIKNNYSSITPENELKPDQIIDQQACQQKGNNTETQVNLSRAAQTLSFCEKNGISLRGHTFVWYSQTPDWFFKENFSSNGNWVSKEVMNKRLESFIKNTFAALKSQYPNLDVYSYDVCNELFLNDGGGLRKSYNTENSGGSNWAKVYGEDNDEFIINAFTYARKYAPANCKLYINDYNEYIDAKTNDIYNIAMKLKEKGVIDGIGMQSHLDVGFPTASQYEKALKKFLSTGLEVQITELDITTNNESSQASLYEEIFKIAMENSDKIPALTIWGTTDNVSWRSSQNPLIMSQGYKPKQAYNKIMALPAVIPPKSAAVVTTTTTKPVTTTTTTTQPKVAVSKYGDANCDNDINMGDVVLIMQSLANPSVYGLKGSDNSHITEKGIANSDVYLSGDGITNSDALAIQKYLIGLISQLPESYSEKKNDNVTTAKNTEVVTAAPTNKTYLNDSFESGAGKFESRGDASIAIDKSSYYSGAQCLYVSGRSDNWNGAAIPLSTSDYVPGNAYSFSAAVMQGSGAAETVQMTLQYTDSTGEDQYKQIATATAKDKTWTDLSNSSYTIPSDAKNLILYVELPDSLTDYYLDDVTIASDGTASKISTGGGKANPKAPDPATPVQTSGNIDPSKPMIAISFDDGAVGSSPSASSMRIINALADNGFHATFFYVGDWIKNSDGEQEVKYAYSKGMEIANHTTTHPYLTQKSASEIRSEVDNCAAKLKRIIGAEPSKLLRLPYLATNQTVQSTLNDYGLITCAIDTEDWNGASKDQIVSKVKSAMQNGSANGAIVLCHETYDATAGAIEELAPYCKSQGWQIVTISEMFAAKGKKINGGQVYTKVG